MVRLEEVEDESYLNKPASTKRDELLADDDEDFTDTDSEISDDDIAVEEDETLYERIAALKDMVPPQTRSKISSIASTISSAASTTINYGGKGLWVLSTTVLLLGLPYALALGDEQLIQEEEKQRALMQEGAQSMMNSGDQSSEAKAAL